MEITIPEKLYALAKLCPSPVYLVGGYVRNALSGLKESADADITSALSVADFIKLANRAGFSVLTVYKTTGTAVFSDGERRYEYAGFRREKYGAGGCHTPVSVEPTADIKEDALRRDFKCNALYYDVKNGVLVDPLGGAADVKARVLDAARDAEEVFARDGLRLMRLARFVAETGFAPTESTLAAAEKYSQNLKDVSAERIYSELGKILSADGKYPFSPVNGHYAGLKILDGTRVLDVIFPELAQGRDMAQRRDFHDHDVLEHSLRAALYAPQKIRLAALLHDVGKPYCMKTFGRYHGHAAVGAKIAKAALLRLKADKKTVAETEFLVAEHMRDLECNESEGKIRAFLVANRDYAEDLIALKQADHTACKDDHGECPTALRWRALYDAMKTDGTPFSYKDLKINAAALKKIGYSGRGIGSELAALFGVCVKSPEKNDGKLLGRLAKEDYAKIAKNRGGESAKND